MWWPYERSKSSACRRVAFSLAAAFSSTTCRRRAWSAAVNRWFSARSVETSPKTAVTRSTLPATVVIAASSGASVLLTAPRAPAAHVCSVTIASRSIDAQRARKSPVERGWLLPYTWGSLVAESSDAARPQQDPVEGVDLLEHDSSASHDAGQRVLCDAHRHEGLVCEQPVETREKRPTTAHDETALHDVVDKLRWG